MDKTVSGEGGEWGTGNGKWGTTTGERDRGMEYFRFHTGDVPQWGQLARLAIVNRPNLKENRHLGEVAASKLTFL